MKRKKPLEENYNSRYDEACQLNRDLTAALATMRRKYEKLLHRFAAASHVGHFDLEKMTRTFASDEEIEAVGKQIDAEIEKEIENEDKKGGNANEAIK